MAAEIGGRHRRAADGCARHAGAPGIAGLGPAVLQNRALGALAAAAQMQNVADGPLVGGDLLLQHHQPGQHGFGPGRAARDVDIHRQDLVDALDDAVDVVHAPGIGAGTHGDHPAGLGHLLVEPQHHRRDFLEDRAGDDQQVRLPGGGAKHFGAEAGDVVAGRDGRGLFHKAAGQAEKHGPEAARPGPVDHGVDGIRKEFMAGAAPFCSGVPSPGRPCARYRPGPPAGWR